jgi:RecA-family ATPase
MSRADEIRDDPFEIFVRSAADDMEDPEPLIKDVLDKGCVAMLSGEYGSGKSFVALDLACCLASGTNWHGHEISQKYKVLYIAAEGARGLKKRLKAWTIGNHNEVPSEYFHFARVSVRFANDEDHYDHLFALIKERKYDLIVVDTLSRCTPGMDENASDMAEFVERVFQLRDAFKAEHTAFLIVHHLGKNKSAGPRGWSGVAAATDFSYIMKRTEASKEFMLTTDRTKDADPLPDHLFALDIHTVDRNNSTSCSLSLVDQRGGQTPTAYAKQAQSNTPPPVSNTSHINKTRRKVKHVSRHRPA